MTTYVVVTGPQGTSVQKAFTFLPLSSHCRYWLVLDTKQKIILLLHVNGYCEVYQSCQELLHAKVTGPSSHGYVTYHALVAISDFYVTDFAGPKKTVET